MKHRAIIQYQILYDRTVIRLDTKGHGEHYMCHWVHGTKPSRIALYLSMSHDERDTPADDVTWAMVEKMQEVYEMTDGKNPGEFSRKHGDGYWVILNEFDTKLKQRR